MLTGDNVLASDSVTQQQEYAGRRLNNLAWLAGAGIVNLAAAMQYELEVKT